jgi:hypothetical protein
MPSSASVAYRWRSACPTNSPSASSRTSATWPLVLCDGNSQGRPGVKHAVLGDAAADQFDLRRRQRQVEGPALATLGVGQPQAPALLVEVLAPRLDRHPAPDASQDHEQVEVALDRAERRHGPGPTPAVGSASACTPRRLTPLKSTVLQGFRGSSLQAAVADRAQHPHRQVGRDPAMAHGDPAVVLARAGPVGANVHERLIEPVGEVLLELYR